MSQLVKIEPKQGGDIGEYDISYWPNFGYGRFGNKVTFSQSIVLASNLNMQQLLLADTDGSGYADLIYLAHTQMHLYMNQHGQGFAEPITIDYPTNVTYDNLNKADVVDLWGTGASGLLLSQLHHTDSLPTFYYYAFSGKNKPYLLTSLDNQYGISTTLTYSNSMRAHLIDIANNKPWPTRLHFPVQVVDTLTTHDMFTDSFMLTNYHYHYGYYDADDREFRGFGYVEQIVSHHFPTPTQATEPTDNNYMGVLHTRTWTHLGINDAALFAAYASDYYTNDDDAWHLPDSHINYNNYTPSTEITRQGYRAFKGHVLRQEVYAVDETEHTLPPSYQVSETNYCAVMRQARGENHYASFRVYTEQTLHYDYEKISDDPRIQHTLNLNVNDYNQVQNVFFVNYPRRDSAANNILPEQQQWHLYGTVTAYVNNAQTATYLLNTVIENRPYVITDNTLIPETVRLLTVTDLQPAVTKLSNLASDKPTSSEYQLADWTRVYYAEVTSSGDTEKLSFGEVKLPRLAYQTATIAIDADAVKTNCFANTPLDDSHPSAFTTELDKGHYNNNIDDTGISTDYWWILSSYPQYQEKDHFYLPIKMIKPYLDSNGQLIETTYQYDSLTELMIVEMKDAVDNVSHIAEIDYHRLLPAKMIDINSNTIETRVDGLYRVVYTSYYGTEDGQAVGFNPIDRSQVLPSPTDLSSVISELSQADPILLGAMASYHYYNDTQIIAPSMPVSTSNLPFAMVVARAVHYPGQDSGGSDADKPLLSIVYSDGMGKSLQVINAVDGSEASGGYHYNSSTHTLEPLTGAVSWHNSGMTLSHIKSYTPFYVDTYDYIPFSTIANKQLSNTNYYDALGRLTHVQTKKGFIAKNKWTPWISQAFDVNDAITDAPYYQANQPNAPNPLPVALQPYYDSNLTSDEREALAYAAQYYSNTPVNNQFDNRGLVIQVNSVNQWPNDATPPVTQQQHLIKKFSYDILGRLVNIHDGRLSQPTVVYTYGQTLLGSAYYINEVDSGQHWSLANIAGNTHWQYDAREITVETTYDSLERPETLKSTQPDAMSGFITSTVEVMIYGEVAPNAEDNNLRGKLYKHYDQSGFNHLLSATLGEKTIISELQFIKIYDDITDWPTNDATRQTLLEPTIYTTHIAYDALERVIAETDALGNQTNPSYYPQSSHLAKIDVTPHVGNMITVVDNIQYNAKLQEVSAILNSTTSALHYTKTYEESTSRLTTIHTQGSSQVVQNLAYNYDPVGNVLQRIDHLAPIQYYDNQQTDGVQTFHYDSAYQLRQATGQEKSSLTSTNRYRSQPHHHEYDAVTNYIRRYNYDVSHNLIDCTSNTSTPKPIDMIISNSSNRAVNADINNDPTNPPTPGQVDSYFDSNGNITCLRNTTHSADPLQWDYRDQLFKAVTVVHTDGTQDGEYYVYDSAGNRVRKVAEQLQSSGVIKYTETRYLGGVEIRQVRQGADYTSSTVQSEYHVLRTMELMSYNHWVAGTPPSGVSGNTLIIYHLKDILNSHVTDVSDTGDIIYQAVYYPFGGQAREYASTAAAAAVKHYRYSGKERDSVTGLYYYGMRYYAPWLGRWLNPDPAGFINGLNRYTFVDNNPTTHVDVDGTAFEVKAGRKTGATHFSISMSDRPNNQNGVGVLTGIHAKLTTLSGLGTFTPPVQNFFTNYPAQNLITMGLNIAHHISISEIKHVTTAFADQLLSSNTGSQAAFENFLTQMGIDPATDPDYLAVVAHSAASAAAAAAGGGPATPPSLTAAKLKVKTAELAYKKAKSAYSTAQLAAMSGSKSKRKSANKATSSNWVLGGQAANLQRKINSTAQALDAAKLKLSDVKNQFSGASAALPGGADAILVATHLKNLVTKLNAAINNLLPGDEGINQFDVKEHADTHILFTDGSVTKTSLDIDHALGLLYTALGIARPARYNSHAKSSSLGGVIKATHNVHVGH